MRCAGASVVRTYLSPVGRAHHANLYLQHLRARTSASIMGSELQPPALRSTPPRCPKPSLALTPAVAHNTRRYEHPSSRVPVSIGVGRSGLSRLTWKMNLRKFAFIGFSKFGR